MDQERIRQSLKYQEWERHVNQQRMRPTTFGKFYDEYMIGGHPLQFANAYSYEAKRNQSFMTTEGTKTFGSYEKLVHSKRDLLVRFLFKNPDLSKKDEVFARSILAEIVARDMLEESIAEVDEDGELAIDFAPTKLDATSKHDPSFSRGGDLVLTAYIQGKKVREPLLLIDVLKSSLKRGGKFKYPAGINQTLGVPVVIFPLGNFTYKNEDYEDTIDHYLDGKVKQTIAIGEYKPFVGIADPDKQKLMSMQRAMLAASCLALKDRLVGGEMTSLTDTVVRKIERVATTLISDNHRTDEVDEIE